MNVHTPDPTAELARLRKRNAELECALIAPSALDTLQPFPDTTLSRVERRLLAHLLTVEIATPRSIEAAACRRNTTSNVASAHVCTLRRKLAPHGLHIATVRHVGYRLLDRPAWRQRLAPTPT